MKKAKLLFTAFLLIILAATSVFAEGVFKIGKIVARPGDEVTVEISLSADEAINSIGIRDIEYDDEALTFKGFTDYEEIEEAAVLSAFDNDKGACVVGFEEANLFDGKICSLIFEVSEDADEDVFSIDATGVLKLDGTILESRVLRGNIEVRHQILGDLNLDETVDLNDAILLLQHSMFSDLYPLDYVGSVDFNHDGDVDMNDAILLLQHSMFPDLYPIEEEECIEISISLDGQLIDFESYGSPAKQINGDTLAPMEGVFEIFGCEYEWDAVTKTVVAQKDSVELELTVGSDFMYINGKASSMGGECTREVDDIVMVPIVYVAKAFGYKVGYSAITGTTIITSPDKKIDILVTPKNGETDVDVDSEIVLTFSEKMFDKDGEALTETYVEDTLQLRAKSATGELLCFSAEISLNGKKITLFPDESFDYNTKYFVLLPKGTLTNSDGAENDRFMAGFTTTDYVVPEPEKNIRIVSDVNKGDDEDGLWRFYYDLYNPYTGEKVYGVPSVEYENKASQLDDSEAYKRGSIIRLDDGRVNHDEEFFIDTPTGEELVYITEVDEEEGLLAVANYNKVTDNGTLECKECIDESIESFDGYVYDFTTGYKVKDGNGDDTLFIKYDENTVVSVVTRDYKFEVINHWAYGKMSLSDISAVADAGKSVLCYNEKALDRNGKFKTGYADYVKAYVGIVDEDLGENELPTADFIIVIVNSDEAAAIDVDCNCEYCGEHGCEETMWCENCESHEHNTAECPNATPDCEYCDEAHETADHECSRCGVKGHETETWCENCESHDHDTADCPDNDDSESDFGGGDIFDDEYDGNATGDDEL